jgi:hypothetical protein
MEDAMTQRSWIGWLAAFALAVTAAAVTAAARLVA